MTAERVQLILDNLRVATTEEALKEAEFRAIFKVLLEATERAPR